jgi:hypothetical protein
MAEHAMPASRSQASQRLPLHLEQMQLFMFWDKQAGHLPSNWHWRRKGRNSEEEGRRTSGRSRCSCIAQQAPALKLALVLGPATGNAPRKAQDQHGEDSSYGGRLENDGG